MMEMVTPCVTQSIIEVMGSMFNCTVHKNEPDELLTDRLSDLAQSGDLCGCKLSFSGSYSGVVFLLLPISVLTKMTHHFMGDQGGVLSEEVTNGTLKEALNIITGRALTKADEAAYTGLGIPEIIDPGTMSLNQDLIIFTSEAEDLLASCVQFDQ